jgi:hypothetical protein
MPVYIIFSQKEFYCKFAIFVGSKKGAGVV